MPSQKWRWTLLIAMVVLFPVTFYYVSPYVILMGAAEGVVAGSFLVFGVLFLSALVFGRAFCGWLCPAGAIGQAVCRFHGKRVRHRWLRWIKYGIWVPWIGLIVWLSIRAGGLHRVDFTYQTWHGISMASLQAVFVFAVVLALIAGLALAIGRRGFCHAVCWMAPFLVLGTRIRDRVRLPGLRLVAQPNLCVRCGSCTKACPMSLDVQKMVESGDMTNAECILCGQCVDRCPKDVLSLRFTRASS